MAGGGERSTEGRNRGPERRKGPPKEIPEGSRFQGYEPYGVQELEIEARNTRFLVECWRTPEGGLIRGELPAVVNGHYGPRLKATVLYLHHHGWMTQTLAIASDDAGQFAVPLLVHGLCWVHAERTVHQRIPGGPAQRQAVDTVRGQIWDLYADLKRYCAQPDEGSQAELAERFDAIFIQKTGYVRLWT